MNVIIISGATATGKTDLSIKMAQKIDAEIVNFDSLLLYKELNIGTAKPSHTERSNVPHHMIDVSSISSPLNAADYFKLAIPAIRNIHSRGKTPLLVGGSGFYLKALLHGMYDSQTSPPEILKRSQELYESEGINPFRSILKQFDHDSFYRYHENDHYRIRRAVEHFWTTGSPLSYAREKKDLENKTLDLTNIHGWNTFHLHLRIPKEDHLKIINHRTSRMIQDGLIDEVKKLFEQGYTGLEKPLQSIGYKESVDFLNGVIKNFDELQERICISTRQLAKSQKTWFNRIDQKETINPLTDFSKIDKYIEYLKSL